MNKDKKTKKLPKWTKIVLCIFSAIILTIAALYTYSYYTVNNIVNKSEKINIKEDELGVVDEEELKQYDDYTEIINIALLGIDSTDSTSGRSDSIMVATLDPIHNKLKLTSFMRDSYVNISNYGYDKLNHAYAYGGANLAINTLNTNFGLNITDFVAVDFASLPKIIDSLGGITIDITEEELNYINGYINNINSVSGTNSPIITTPGAHHVDGAQALAYSRIRYTSGGDFKRTERQRTVLTALFNKALNVPATQYLDVISTLAQYATTNLNTNEILKLATKIGSMGLNGVTIEQQRFPIDGYCEGTMINGIYYLTFDTTATRTQVMNYIFNDQLPQ
ncbi:MAG: LCP family protein [Romboutsia timonensis]